MAISTFGGPVEVPCAGVMRLQWRCSRGSITGICWMTRPWPRPSELSAAATVNALRRQNALEEIIEITKGGAQASMDSLGSTVTCQNSILCLRALGHHVQVGLMKDSHAHPAIPMGVVVAREIDIRGSRGMSPKNYPSVFNMIRSGVVAPKSLIGAELTLEEGTELLTQMDQLPGTGVAVITSL